MLFFFWQLSTLSRPKTRFSEHRGEFSVEEVRQTESDRWDRLHITFRITNGTKYKWEHLTYQLVGKDEKGALALTEWGSEYSWVVQPGAEAYVTVRVDSNKDVRS